ncbi:NADH:ubiquinone reductase (Na(+)-transporting) subunit C [Roseivirga misakiensis]|uniref:Na(+)-translocating NADH-quinone reductase subunit C n=1 Tax=Roseivirga misakiensis TaxID=1563681 RepID=A0A1E5SYK0_9BACT|nr:NADH:ubiquinone reductase (Na(+)-transporting) subunit C [Roseivirga misakiensis]OEK04199.1 NADH:ubiquinone reductase (Na(+)-transporting) subunit C [Roseivirga misakiensis]
MQQSNKYIIIFSLVLTAVLGGMLSGVSQVLGPAQKKAQDLDTKKQILGAIPSEKEALAGMEAEQILARYKEVISSEVADFQGNLVDTNEKGGAMVAEEVNIEKNYKKSAEDRMFPVFKYTNNGEEAYILPVYGAGLWDAIWGFVAVNPDLKSVRGISFDHKGETPGLGARITSDDIQARYQGKSLYNDNGEFVAITMVKGEKTPEDKLGPNKVDGLAGATLTANGVNDMLMNYITYYQKYFDKHVRGGAMTLNNQ